MSYYNHSNPYFSYPGFAQAAAAYKHGLNSTYGSVGPMAHNHQHQHNHLQGPHQHHHHAQPHAPVPQMGGNNYFSIQAAALAARNLYAQSIAAAQAQAQAQAAQLVSNLSPKAPNIMSENVLNEFKSKAPASTPSHQSSYIDEYRAKADEEPKQKVQGNTIHFHF